MSSISQPPKHLYPLNIALRAQRLIQGTLFFDVFVDTATGQYVRIIPNAEGTIKKFLVSEAGWSEETYETSWACFESYLKEFQNPIFHRTVYSMISHWDWYVSRLGEFIDFAQKYVDPKRQTNRDLLKLSFKPFLTQIEMIKSETGIPLNIDNDTLDLVEEMHLVRNLGMHNEWEINETYLKKTKMKNMKLGDKRVFEIAEVTSWHAAFIQLINMLSTDIAILYAEVPKYE